MREAWILQVKLTTNEQIQRPLQTLHLLYHELCPDRRQYLYALEAREFGRQLDLFVRLRRSESPVLWPELTFDDGHISNFEYAAPALQSQGLTGRFFITVGWTGKRPGYMGWSEVRSLHEAGHSIGAHGLTHTLLTHCSDKDLRTELDGARLELEDRLGASITTMSLPGGRYNRRVLAACESAGYTEVYTSIPRAETMPQGHLIGRLNIRADMSLEWIVGLFEPGSRVLSGMERQYRMKAAAKALLGDALYEKLWARLNRKELDAE